MNKTLHGTLALTALTLALTSCLAQAQSQTTVSDQDQAAELDAVVVKGTRVFDMPPSALTGGYTVRAATVGSRTSTLLRGIPQSVTVVTRERIEDQNLDSLDELAEHTPGMRILTNDVGRSSVYARGYEYSEFNLDGLSAPMASINGTLPSLAAVDRVEIMRGPSGLLNSTSELGGIVNLVLKRPTYDFHANLEGRYGSFAQHHLAGDVSGPLNASGSLRGRLVAAEDHTDGFTDHAANTGRTVYAALEQDFGANTHGFLAYLGQDRDITVSNGLPTDPDGNLLDLPASTFVGARWNQFNARSNDVIGELTHNFQGDSQGRIAARYSDRDASCNYVFGGSALAADGTLSMAGLGCQVDETAFSLDSSFSQVFDLFGNPGGYVIGIDHKRFDTDARRARYRSRTPIELSDFPNLPYLDIMSNPGSRLSATDTVLRETGLYAKATVRPVAALAIIAGARVSRYRLEHTDLTSGQYEQRSDAGKVTPYAGLILDLGQHYSLYASYSKIFKPQTAFDKNGKLVGPRTGSQVEAGLKAGFLDDKLNARISVFRLTDRDHAAAVPGQNYSAPLDARRVKGAEVEVNGSPVKGLELIAGYTWLDTQVTPGALVKGDPAAIYLLMPQDSFKFWAKYTVQGTPLRGLMFGLGATVSSGFASSQGIQAPGYAVVDALLGYQVNQRLSLRLNVNNVFDKSYYSRVGSTGTFNFLGAPRSVLASIQYTY